MEALTQSTYLSLIKSLIINLEQVLTEIDQNDITITDETMVCSFRTMSKTLQRIFSKWDKNKVRPVEGSRRSQSVDSKPVIESLFHESFLYGGTQDNDSLATPKTFESKVTSTVATTSERKVAIVERIRKKMRMEIEDSDEETDRPRTTLGSNVVNSEKASETEITRDPNFEKIDDNYKCKICDKVMNKNNIQSHLSGKNHRNKSQENSCSDRKTSITKMEDNIARILDSVEPKLRKNEAGDPYIIVRNSASSFYCNLCKVEISGVDKNLLEHVQGQIHKRLCECSL